MRSNNLLALYFYLTAILFISCKKDGEPQIKIFMNNDIGMIPYGKSKEFDLVIRNEGGSDLIIDNIQPSCKCIVQDVKKLKIDPDSTGTVKLRMFSNDYGDLEETIAIISNTEQRFHLIKVNATTPYEK